MKQSIKWNDIRLFLAVSRFESLQITARTLGVSAPTLSRRMAALEQQIGHPLFDRTARGLAISKAASELVTLAEEMETAGLAIERWRDGKLRRQVVKISAGTWTTEYLAEHINEIWHRDDDFVVQFTPSDRDVDIGRRAADIGIRNRRPTGAHLAGRQLSIVRFAPYMPKGDLAEASQAPWIIVDDGGHLTPSAQYVVRNWADQDIVRTSSAHNALTLATAGHGRIVLPTFIGDHVPAMSRIGGAIDELQHHQWMVLHHDGRHVARVRTVKERLSQLLTWDPLQTD